MPTPHLDIDNARWPDQIATMRRSLDNHESPFLLENLPKYHHLPVIKKGQFWYITANQWPYDHTRNHYLIISRAYWTRLEDITPEASQELITLAQWLKKGSIVPAGPYVFVSATAIIPAPLSIISTGNLLSPISPLPITTASTFPSAKNTKKSNKNDHFVYN